jgi:hypothetical protein
MRKYIWHGPVLVPVLEPEKRLLVSLMVKYRNCGLYTFYRNMWKYAVK